MKKAILTLALLVQIGFAMATEKNKNTVQARHENVKMYQQAGTSSNLLKELSTTDRIEIIRRLNNQWTMVLVNGVAGYVLHSELANATPHQSLASATTKQK